jgi:Uncharacterized conserved protein (DUF2075)
MIWQAALVENRRTHGWAGRARDFLQAPGEVIESALEEHLKGLLGLGASRSQIESWIEEINLTKQALRDLAIAFPSIQDWGVILEYELPLEGGRRPDVILLGPENIFVLEFKQHSSIQRAFLDQVAAYARDLSEYHSKSHGIEVIPVLVPTSVKNQNDQIESVRIVSPELLAAFLSKYANDKEAISYEDWLAGDYAPLPTLINAAKMIFSHQNLPAIKRAESLGVNKAVKRLNEVAKRASKNSERVLAFVSGVPGAGKTLVGLQLVYENSDLAAKSVFLSGNGPLVEVLSAALKSKVFVKDLHAFIKSYGTSSKKPPQNLIVFDEAQRAWDAEHMAAKKEISYSEPELLINIGEKIDGWATLVGLIGHGQEINSGEEAGIDGWSEALDSKFKVSNWKVVVPPRFSKSFPKQEIEEYQELDLNNSLRSRRASDLHEWVNLLLLGKLSEASRIANMLIDYPIYVTRDLESAKDYVSSYYAGQIEKRYGIIASSKDKLLPNFGINNDFQSTKRVKNAPWYNNPVGEPGSCCNFQEVVTEFACQGLELDMAITAWGNDFYWTGKEWEIKKMRPKFPVKDLFQLRMNSYRVLLTRSRDGLVLFVPPVAELDATEHALLAAGVRPLLSLVPLKEVG